MEYINFVLSLYISQVRDGPSEFGATFLGWAPVTPLFSSFVYATPCPLLSLSQFWNGLSFYSSRPQNFVLNRNYEKSYALWVTYFREKRSSWLCTIVAPRPLILTHTTRSKEIYMLVKLMMIYYFLSNLYKASFFKTIANNLLNQQNPWNSDLPKFCL